MIIPANIVFKKVGEETVLLNFDLGIYYGLDPVGTRIFELIAEGKDRDALIEAIAGEYDVAREQAAHDIDHLLTELESKGLIERVKR